MNTQRSDAVETMHSGPTQEWVERRRNVIAAAAAVFREMGYEKGTTKAIANRLGMSQPAVYYYVGSKPDLIGEIAQVVAHDLTAALNDAIASSSDPVDQLKAVITNFAVAALSNLDVFATYWHEQKHIPADIAHSVAESESRFIARITELVVKAQQLGALPARHPSVVARGIIGMVYATYRWYQPDGDLTPAEIADVYIDTVGLHRPPVT